MDIPESELEEAIRHTGAKTNRQRRLQSLAEKFGTLEGFMTQEELRQGREDA